MSGVIETIGAMILLLMIPSDPKNAWIFRFSRPRLVMALVMLIIILVFLWFSSLTWRDSRWVNRGNLRIQTALYKYGRFLPGIVITYAFVFCGGFLSYLIYLNNYNLTTRAGVLLRLSPFVILGFTRALQLAIIFFFLIYKLPKPKIRSYGDTAILIDPQKITFILASIALLLIMLSVMVDVIEQYNIWGKPILGFRKIVDLDREANIPTFFSTAILLFASSLLGIIAYLKRSKGEPYKYHWSILSLIFLYFAIDESSVLHEKMGQLLDSAFHLRGFFYYGWVVLGIIFVFVLGIMYLKFILDLPMVYKKMFIASLSLFFLGAIGAEMVSGWYTDIYHKNWAVYNVLTTVEEALEMGGVILFIHFLLTYIKDVYPQIQFLIVSRNLEIE
jgi:hypothetical protein